MYNHIQITLQLESPSCSNVYSMQLWFKIRFWYACTYINTYIHRRMQQLMTLGWAWASPTLAGLCIVHVCVCLDRFNEHIPLYLANVYFSPVKWATAKL